MKNIINWFVNNSVAANLFMILIIISGYVTLPKILMEIFPAPVLDIISVSVPYPGASPEDIEKSICIKIEENIAGVESIKKIRSTSLENQGLVYIELLPGEDISIFLPQFSTTEPKATAKEISKTVAINGLTPLLLKKFLVFLGILKIKLNLVYKEKK